MSHPLLYRKAGPVPYTVGTTDITDYAGRFVKPHTDGTAIPIAANTDAPAGLLAVGNGIGKTCEVVPLGSGDFYYAQLAASPGTIVPGTLLEIDAAGRLIADAGGSGTVVARALEVGTGKGLQLIGVELLKTSGTVSVLNTVTTCVVTDNEDGTATVSGAVEVAGKYVVQVILTTDGALATPDDFGDLAAVANTTILRELTTDARAEIVTHTDGTWGLTVTGIDAPALHAAAFVAGKLTIATPGAISGN